MGGGVARILTAVLQAQQMTILLPQEGQCTEAKVQLKTNRPSHSLSSPLVSHPAPAQIKTLAKGLGEGGLNDTQEVDLAIVSHLMEASHFS